MTQTTDSTATVLPYASLDEPTQRLVEQVAATKSPLVITRDGGAAVVVLEAGHYEELQRKLTLLEHVALGKRDLDAGRTYTQEEVEAMMNEWFGEIK